MIDYSRHLSTARLLGRHIPCTIVVPGVEAPSSLPARCRDLPAQTGRSLCVAISIGGWLEEGFQGRRTTRSASPIVNQIPHYHAWRRYWRCCRRNPCVCCRVAVLPCCLVAVWVAKSQRWWGASVPSPPWLLPPFCSLLDQPHSPPPIGNNHYVHSPPPTSARLSYSAVQLARPRILTSVAASGDVRQTDFSRNRTARQRTTGLLVPNRLNSLYHDHLGRRVRDQRGRRPA